MTCKIACSRLAHKFAFVARLNSQARQAAADRAWAAISRFYATCQAKPPGKKGYPRFQRDCRSVEYKVTGWKLDPDGKHVTFTDGCGIGRVKLIGTRDLATFAPEQFKRVRLIRRADGYYAQLVLQTERRVAHVPTGRVVGIDVGLHAYTIDSEGQAVANPRFIDHVEHLVRRRSQRLSRKSLHHKQGKKPKQNHAARQRAKHNRYAPATPLVLRPAQQPVPTPPAPASRPASHPALSAPPPPRRRQSANWHRARRVLAKTYLHLQRQREDLARKQANALVSSHDLIALEDLQIRNLVKNRRLAKAISDVGWARFRHWAEYYGRLQQVPVMAVPPQYTSQVCSGCGTLVRKSLSVRRHVCPHCGLILDRDHNAALVIREAGLARAIQQGVWDPRDNGSWRVVMVVVPWGTREPNAWGQPGSCGPLRGGPLPRQAEPRISRIHPGRVSILVMPVMPVIPGTCTVAPWHSSCLYRRSVHKSIGPSPTALSLVTVTHTLADGASRHAAPAEHGARTVPRMAHVQKAHVQKG